MLNTLNQNIFKKYYHWWI